MEWVLLVVLVVVVVIVAKWVLPPGKKYLALHDQVARERREKQQRVESKAKETATSLGSSSRPRGAASHTASGRSSPAPSETRVFPHGSVDLRELESFRTRIKGTGYVVPDAERLDVGGTTYALIREPSNRHDPNAIAVHDGVRAVGYVSSARAGSMAPVLDSMGAPAYLVAGAAPGEAGIRLWMDLPKLDALRRFAKGRRS
jgi:hypothetical protein